MLNKDQWVCLELHMHINTPGVPDGTMSFWVDDQLALEQTGMHWRDVEELQLNKAWLQHYIAEGDADQPNRVWFDDVVVSTERIGCGTPGDGDGDGDPGDGDGDSGDGDSGDGDPVDDESDDAADDDSGTEGPSATEPGTSDGCACSSTRDRSPWAAAWIVLLVGIATRRRAA